MPIGVGIIGCGGIARFHLKGYEEAGAKVVQVCDINPASAKGTAERYGAGWSTDYAKLLADPSIDAVSICLPNHLHFKPSADALAAGKHVLCEKPMTTTPEDARELVKLVESSGKLFQIAYMKRFLPAFQKAREFVPRIGMPLTGCVKVYHPFPETNWNGDGWTLGKATAGGGPLCHSGSHMLDIMRFLFGDPVSVDARVKMKPGKDVDYFTHAYLEMANGSTVSFECAWIPLTHIGFRNDGWDERVELTGDRGRIEVLSTRWDRPEQDPPVLRVYLEDEGAVREIYSPPVNPFIGEVEAFVRSVEKGERPSPDVHDGYMVQVIIDAIYRSGEQQRPIEIRSDFR